MTESRVIIFREGITEGEITLKLCKHLGLPRKTRVCQYAIGAGTVYASYDPKNSAINHPGIREIITEVVGPGWVSVDFDYSAGANVSAFLNVLVDRLGGLDLKVIYSQLPDDFFHWWKYPDQYNPASNPEVTASIVQAIKAKAAELEEQRRQNTPKKRKKRQPSVDE